MAKRRRRYKETSLSSAIVILNILIVLVMGFLVFFVYKYITSEQDTPARTLPETQPPLEETYTDELFVETETETTTELSITKASTTLQELDTYSDDDAEPAFADMGYDKSFFADDFFIGDSIMTGFSGFGYLPNEIVFAKIGLNPESALTEIIDEKTAVERAGTLEPKRIYIMLGTNGLSYMSGDYMAKQMGKLISELKGISENSTIVLMTIPPVTEAHEVNKPEENNDKINLYNNLLKSLAKDNGCILSDINTLLVDDDGYLQSKYAERDGLHFKDAAYKAVLSKLQSDLSLQ